jgi:hypothetical protein
MEIIVDLFGWMGPVLKSFAAMRTNDGIVSWLLGNAVLIGGILYYGRMRAKRTPDKKDDNFWSGLQGMFSFMAPKMKLPPDEPTTDESEVQDGQKT